MRRQQRRRRKEQGQGQGQGQGGGGSRTAAPATAAIAEQWRTQHTRSQFPAAFLEPAAVIIMPCDRLGCMPVAHAPMHTRSIWGGHARARGAGEKECKNKRVCIKKITQSHLDKRLVRGFAQLLTCFAHACVDRQDGCGCDGQGIGLEAHGGRLRLGAV